MRTNASDKQISGQHCLPFDEVGQNDVSLVGGKNASLGELTKADTPVPPGFATTTEFYRTFMEKNGLWDPIHDELEEFNPEATDSATEVSNRIQNRIESASVPPSLDRSLRDSWQNLRDRCGVDGDLRLAVRSSATAEDLPDASFAGQQDTYLNVVGLDDLRDKVVRCISSLFTARAITYREKNGFDHDDVEISVGVQRLVNAKASGVMFTLNPQNGDRSKVQIEGNWGLGESVVSGEVTPDNFLVDKAVFEIVERNISPKLIKTEIVEDGTEECEVDEDKQSVPCITDDEIIQLTEYGKKIERHYGTPQDIEWVIDDDLEFPENIFIVQSRPETVWSQKETKSDIPAEGNDSTEMILNSLSKSW